MWPFLFLECHTNGSSITDFAANIDFAVMILHGVLDDGQTKAGAAGLLGVALVHTIETLKYFVLMFRSNADAVIADADLYSTLLFRNRNLYLATLIVVLNGIVAEKHPHGASLLPRPAETNE